MARYRLIIKPRAPFQTPLHSDTLFGHICWALRYLKGEDKLIEFLSAFNVGNSPLILSSGFPNGYLPMPVLRPLSDKEEKLLWEKYERGKTRLGFTRELKIFKKVSYIQISALQMLKDDLSYYNLYDKHLNGDITLENPTVRSMDEQFSKTIEVWHNAKNRLTDRVMEGKLFAKSDTFYNNGAELVIYINDTYFSREMLFEIIYFIARSGYGADKSSGRGIFEFELLDEWELPESENPNAFLNLSQYHPMEGDFRDGFYDMAIKFGKIGGHWAAGIDGGPYKMPILMLNPGSVFQTDNDRPFYGGIIKNVHKKEGVVHYGIALPLKVRVT
ncbi:MAG: hypothetical protein IT392_10060 [Nitrospirae bacterium]|nr:hypothetical protein [Nitrospirota bacterium]